MKVVFITGASSGMGRATAALLVQHGYIVYAAARRVARMKDLEAMGIHIIEMDVSDESAVETGVKTIFREQGKIDILINNAGFGAYGALEDLPISEAKYQLDVNLFGVASLIQLVLPKMRAQGSGKIINVTSVGGKFAMPYSGWYHASKYALEGLSDSLRMEVKPFGIDVIVIEPGGIQSEWNGIAMEHLKKNAIDSVYKESIEKLIAMNVKLMEVMKRSKQSEPMVIARLIKKAIEDRLPKIRYVGGYNAKLILFLRTLLSDKLFDKALLSQL